MGKEYIKLGTLVKSKDKDKYGKPSYYISLYDDIELTVNGKKVTKKNISAQGMESKLQAQIDSGKLDEDAVEKIEKKISRYAKGGDLNFVKHEFTVVVGE